MENVHSVEISDAYRCASQHEMQHDNFIHATLKKYRRDLNPIRSGRFANRAARDGGLRGRLVGCPRADRRSSAVLVDTGDLDVRTTDPTERPIAVTMVTLPSLSLSRVPS